MKWIDSTDLNAWANRRDCQANLPHLVRKLIRATSSSIKSIKFPAGENVLIGGWDGILEVAEETEYLPAGVSLWEFGANKDIKGKAYDDFEKRTNNPLGFKQEESTYIFVTPRLWTKKDDWIIEKKKAGIWKDIKVIDSEILEEWIEIAPSVGAWLAKKHLNKYPQGIQPCDDFWEEWSAGKPYNLIPEIVLGGRECEQNKIVERFENPAIIAVQGISREEALAFIIASFKVNPAKEEDFFARSIIVDNVDAFRELTNHNQPLILIPRFEDDGVLNRAVQKRHTVIVPLGADASSNWTDIIKLPQITRDAFISAMVKVGFSKESAEKYSKETARNITILRRQLGFVRNTPVWALPESVNDIVPALIVGRWNENVEGDKKILSHITNDTYENYAKKLSRWLYQPDSPIQKIGSTWRLTSPLDAWTNASKSLTGKDFEALQNSFMEIASEFDPKFDLEPDKRFMAGVLGKNRSYSGWIREGIIQSLILVSVYSDKLQLAIPFQAESWVDQIIAKLLNSDNTLIWKSFENLLPLIAEASPSAFLDAVEKHLANDNSPIMSLFEEDPGMIIPTCYHTGLLWALESLAWLPDYLSRSALILAKLAARDPGGRISNRPINSLNEIFKPWHYQTLASLDERIEVLKLIAVREKKISWEFLIKLLPEFSDVGHPTHKARWRMFDIESRREILYQEIFDMHSAVIDILISIFDYSETKFSQLLKVSDAINLTQDSRNKILTFVESIIPKINQRDFVAWATLRKLLSSHRSYPTANWSLSETDLIKYENLYNLITPTDDIKREIWIFDEHCPQFPEGNPDRKNSYENYNEMVFQKRMEFVNRIYNTSGIDKIIELSSLVKEPGIFGETIGNILENEDDIIRCCGLLTIDNADRRFVESFIWRISVKHDLKWVIGLYEKLKSLEFDDSAIALYFNSMNQVQELWDFIESTNTEIAHKYWQKIYPNFYNKSKETISYGLIKLLEVKRYISAVNIGSHFVKDISSELIIEMLEKAGCEKADEQTRLDQYHINEIFENLDQRHDVETEIMLRLEWLYLPILASYNNQRPPKRLHEELSKSPDFFIDLIKMIYKPDDDHIVEDETVDIPDELIKNRAEQAYKLINSWKNIPGVDADGKIDKDFLNTWINKTRDLAIICGRLEVVDLYIGQVLAQYLEERDKSWPPDDICDLIEKLNSDELNRNFHTAVINKRGSTIRMPEDGGNIEKGNANYFRKLAGVYRNRFPVVAKILDQIAKDYEHDAKREDDQAERRKLEN